MKTTVSETIHIKGIGVSSGIVIGKAFMVDPGKTEISSHYSLETQREIDTEKQAFRRAVEATRDQFHNTKKKLKKKGYKEAGYVVDAYLMILRDKALIQETLTHIEKEKIDAAWALRSTLKDLERVFSEIEDEYLKERRNDLQYVGQRIMQNLTKAEDAEIRPVREKVIIVAHD